MLTVPLLGGVRILARGGEEVVLVVEEELQEEEVDAHPSDRLRFSLPMQEYAVREGQPLGLGGHLLKNNVFLVFFFAWPFLLLRVFFFCVFPNLRNTSKNRKHKSKHVSESDTECERGLKN